MQSRTLLLCLFPILAACSTSTSAPEPANASITGTATYRERMMLPPKAMLEVVLEDVSLADAPADVIARTEVPATTAPPYKFAIAFDPSRINAGHRYHVRARITADGTLMFQSDAGYSVLGTGNVQHVDILLKRVSTATSNASAKAQQMSGMYSYMADAGWFVDCLSGVRLAVAQEGDNAALESAYSKARSMPGAPMLAAVEGRVEDRMPMEGSRARPTLIVEKYISVEPGSCSGTGSTAQLENTYWKLMTLEGQSVETPERAREIHFVLNHESRQMKGFAGCNGMTANYQLDGENLKLGGIARTMMACATGMQIERQVHDVLPRVEGWKISGETLQLTDENGTVIATFESRYMK